jgi:hypothetical protein
LDEIVLNTEAHPFPRFEPSPMFWTGWKRKPRDADGKLIEQKKADDVKKPEEKRPMPPQADPVAAPAEAVPKVPVVEAATPKTGEKAGQAEKVLVPVEKVGAKVADVGAAAKVAEDKMAQGNKVS